jgi:hypothetical protein
MVDAKIAEYKAAGKSPFDLLDPTKPDFLGKPEILHAASSPWAPPPLDQAAAAAADRLSRSVIAPPTGSTIPAPPPIVMPTQAAPIQRVHTPGEPPGDYLKSLEK